MSIHAVSAAFKHDCPSPTAKLVLLALANYADADGLAYPSVKKIVSETGLSERAVRSALKVLVEAGAIEIEARRRGDGTQKSSEYRLTLQTAPAAPSEADRVHEVPVQTAPAAPLTTFEPSPEPSLKAREAEQPLAERLWALQPVTGGKRKATKPDVANALKAALKRGGDADEIERALTAYYRLPDCRKEDGRFARGAAVMLTADRWRDFIPAEKPKAPVIADDPALRAFRSRHFADTGEWRPEWGPRPSPSPANDTPAQDAA